MIRCQSRFPLYYLWSSSLIAKCPLPLSLLFNTVNGYQALWCWLCQLFEAVPGTTLASDSRARDGTAKKVQGPRHGSCQNTFCLQTMRQAPYSGALGHYTENRLPGQVRADNWYSFASTIHSRVQHLHRICQEYLTIDSLLKEWFQSMKIALCCKKCRLEHWYLSLLFNTVNGYQALWCWLCQLFEAVPGTTLASDSRARDGTAKKVQGPRHGSCQNTFCLQTMRQAPYSGALGHYTENRLPGQVRADNWYSFASTIHSRVQHLHRICQEYLTIDSLLKEWFQSMKIALCCKKCRLEHWYLY